MGGGVVISFWEKFQGAFLSIVYFDQGASLLVDFIILNAKKSYFLQGRDH